MPLVKTLDRIEQDVASGDYGKARDRLHGLISTYPDDLSLRRRLGDVYWQLQYPAMAGRYWYLEERRSPEKVQACAAFERACGNRSLLILLALKYRGDVEAISDAFARRTLLRLQKQVRDEYGYVVDARKRSTEKIKWAPSPKRVWLDRVVLIGLFVILILTGIGAVTLYSWIFS